MISTSWNDTILALATPPGIGAIGVLRVSGDKAIAMVNALFPSKDLSAQATHTLHVGYLKTGDTLLDEVVISLYKGPRSYTGEDVVEISCHGSPFVQEQVIQALIGQGARLAKPGEFTQRAFLKGKMDLAQAESVADLIAANSEASRNTALHHIRGGFSNALKELREQVLQFSALIELELDFSQEDVEFADRTKFCALLEKARVLVNDLLKSFQLGNVIRNGVSVAIVGKPNAGKSTLLNTLLNENRAIVSDIAGTTRDTIEELININGILFRLIDTAGIRDSVDTIETMGVEKSREKMRSADLVLYLFDVSAETAATLHTELATIQEANPRFLAVGNKVDTLGEEKASAKFPGESVLYISARTHLHVDLLKERLVDKVLEGTVNTESTIVTNARHYASLKQVNDSLSDIVAGLDNHVPGDLLALDIRRCLYYLGEITGEVTNEEQLDYIFSKFCIGK
ncbi:MAG: tRNA uridine-5-carboxymethylaminomethyl(34) synthesis GTPase MnmE [Chitinophagales bacterium]|nr:tRNA uridine-5-carboxymethylaminomethyl(34) synthesis GTPase MnmE [Chitinophagales bacterium]